MKALVTGAAGQLGSDLIKHCIEAGDEVIGIARADLDITDQQAVHAIIGATRPDVVFNCAAWTAVDACEADPDRALLVNGTSVGYLAEGAANSGAHLVQVSTDYVFDGDKSGAYVESDQTNPQSVYGVSKLAGETEARASDAAVVRTSWVCSAHGGNMVATVLSLLKQHPVLRFVSDQHGCPTFTGDLAGALRQIGLERHHGVLHVTNAGPVSWYEFAQEVVQTAGEDPNRVEPIRTDEMLPARPAKRPSNSVLSNARYQSLGFAPLPDFRESLPAVVAAYL